MNFLKRFIGSVSSSQTPQRAGFQAVDSVRVPKSCAAETQAHLRLAGERQNEGLVVWTGIQEGALFQVRSVVRPDQRPIRTSSGICVVLESDALHQLNVMSYARGERIFAQVHSHPGQAYHSKMDDEYAVVTAVGGLSLVVPDFAERAFSVRECAVYRLTSRGVWASLTARQATSLISVVEDKAR